MKVFKGYNTGSYYSFVIIRGKGRLAVIHKVTNLTLPETKVSVGFKRIQTHQTNNFSIAALKSICIYNHLLLNWPLTELTHRRCQYQYTM